MPVQHLHGQRSGLRKALFALRGRVPRGLRLGVWGWIGRRIFKERGFEKGQGLFRSIELETRTRCNSTCTFCAASIQNDKRPDIYMPEPLYVKLLDELAGLDYDGAIKFFVNNEPLLDARTARFIQMTKERLPRVRTEVHTNGLKLNVRNGRELLEAGLDLLYINNYTSTNEVHRGVKAFLEEVAPDFPDREIVCHVRLLDERLLNRAGTAPNAEPEPRSLALPCILPFEEVVVTADGRVTICCQDHSFDAAVGNLNSERLQDIWYGSGLSALRAQLMKGDRSGHQLCNGCDFRGYKDEHLGSGTRVLHRMVGDLLH